MESFEAKISRLLFNKANHNPKPQASMELLLKYVYDTVLVPAHRLLKLQEEYTLSTLSFDEDSGYGDMGDGFEERPVAMLTVYRGDETEAVFAYELSFDGETESSPAALWSHLVAPNYVATSQEMHAIPADVFNSGDSEFEFNRFHSLDMNEAVELVQQDLLAVFDQLL